jgi:hypothetical protein
MSKALDMAELIRTRLLSAPTGSERTTPVDLTDVDVIVDRQKNILSMISLAVSKAKGTAIVILWDGFRSEDGEQASPRLVNSYQIRVYSKPVIAGDNLLADDVMESIILRLWQWRPVAGDAYFNEARIVDGGLIPDKAFLVYDLQVTLSRNL